MISFELVATVTRLHQSDSRQAGAAQLAAMSGASSVLVFGKDVEIGLFLPAPGLPQTLRGGARWQAFLRTCADPALAHASLPDPLGSADTDAYAVAGADGLAVLVFLGARPDPALCAALAALLPMLGSKLAAERAALASDGHATVARDSSRRASTLNTALDLNRRELQAAYRSVERELESRRAAEAKLRAADRRKDEFLAMLAHELRNPLAPISMAAQVLSIGPVSPARLHQTCQIIERQVNHMTTLLDDLLDVARVTGGVVTLARQTLDMRAIVGDALEQTRPLLNARGHHLTLELPQHPTCVCGDATRLVQITANLLSNAARYTPPGGEISLSVALDGNDVLLAVRDNGIGIGADLLDHVFDLFTQGERSSDRAQGGLGLGLALVRSLVQRHGGTVEARSSGRNQGSQFLVRLPSASAPELDPAAPMQASVPARVDGLNILIVDDNADAARTLALYLQALGHEVRVAFDGAGAMDMVARQAPRVLLLDIGLPDMDGYTLAAALRALPHTADALFIALTGYGQPADRTRSRQAGFTHHLTKPVDAAALAQLLEQVAQACAVDAR